MAGHQNMATIQAPRKTMTLIILHSKFSCYLAAHTHTHHSHQKKVIHPNQTSFERKNYYQYQQQKIRNKI